MYDDITAITTIAFMSTDYAAAFGAFPFDFIIHEKFWKGQFAPGYPVLR